MPCLPCCDPSIRPYWYVLMTLRPAWRFAASHSLGCESASLGPSGGIEGFALDAWREKEWIAWTTWAGLLGRSERRGYVCSFSRTGRLFGIIQTVGHRVSTSITVSRDRYLCPVQELGDVFHLHQHTQGLDVPEQTASWTLCTLPTPE